MQIRHIHLRLQVNEMKTVYYMRTHTIAYFDIDGFFRAIVNLRMKATLGRGYVFFRLSFSVHQPTHLVNGAFASI